MIIDGFELHQTCGACPEQYDVYLKGSKKIVAYFRLRHGCFTVEMPDDGGKLVYESEDMMGDGIFDPDERDKYLRLAIDAVKKELACGENTG